MLWIFVAKSTGGDVWRLAVAASFWRVGRSVVRRSRRTDGGGMLVGRTLDGEVDVDVGEVLFGFGVGFGFGGAGVVFGPSVKSPQSSNESSSHVCGGETG